MPGLGESVPGRIQPVHRVNHAPYADRNLLE